MKIIPHRKAQIGDLVVAVFDEASYYSVDPKEVSRLAIKTVMHMLRHVRKRSNRIPLLTGCTDVADASQAHRLK